MADLFETATKSKFRYPSRKGNITTEDLWDLPLSSKSGLISLDEVAKTLNKEIKEAEEESFVEEKSSVSKDLEAKFDIVKRVIEVRKGENALLLQAKKDGQNNIQIRQLIAEKKNEVRKNLSIEELEKLIVE